ncbi:MAG TPA: hypothetical protein VG033_10405 [Candidatus Acidoferrales bacterium]|jgi:hypothetical protein|nr:hypothetical protein [Candidatus Acidoferrales bacterium]
MEEAVFAAPSPDATRRNGVLDLVHSDPQFQNPGFWVTYRHTKSESGTMKARHLASSHELLGFLESLGLDPERPLVCDAIRELHTRGWASISEVWLSKNEIREHRLA